ncbi:MAG: BrnA antitoxin family protein [Bdellovibrionota bacterium]
MKKEYDLSKMKLVRRGPIVKSTAKIQKTVRLDADVVAWLLKESRAEGVGYLTLLNKKLRESMEKPGVLARIVNLEQKFEKIAGSRASKKAK